jgi:hypothetical protein
LPFDVPWLAWEERVPHQRWTARAVEQYVVHGRTVTIATDETRAGNAHACTPADVCGVSDAFRTLNATASSTPVATPIEWARSSSATWTTA